MRIRFCQYKKSENRREYNPEVRLFAFWRSSCSFRVHKALNLKKISFEIVPVNKKNGVHKSWIFSQINPAQLVPILVIHGNIPTESLPIFEYIDEDFPDQGMRLIPKIEHNDKKASLFKRFQVRRLCEVINSNT